MSHSAVLIVSRPEIHIVGLSAITSLREAAQQRTLETMVETFNARAAEIANCLDPATYHVQIFPDDPNFNEDTRFQVIIGSHVELLDNRPTGMIGHTIPAGEFAKVTHLGPQSEIGQTYEYMNRVWSREAGRQFAGHEIEIWDERYRPASPDNEIDLYMALR